MNLSNGFLPLAPLMHADPTAIGLWDIDRAAGVWRPAEQPAGPDRWAGDGLQALPRDQLVLLRLHGDPLAILHLPSGIVDPEELLPAAWRLASAEIVSHVRSYGCLPVPESADDLRDALREAPDGGRTGCPSARPVRPPGEAAVILCTVGEGGGREGMLARSLASLAALRVAAGMCLEIIVVDNRPAVTNTRELVERISARAGARAGVRVRYVAEPRPGLARARNTGVAAASAARFVAFTDDDVILDEDWLAWLLAPMADDRVHVTTGLVMPLSLKTPAAKRFEQYAGFGKGLSRERYDMAENRAPDRFLYPYWGGMFGSGNSMAFRRDALLAAGGFDEALGAGTGTAGGEDLAAFSDVILAGGMLAYEPRSVCWHEHRGDEAALRAQVGNYGIGLTAVLWRYLIRDWRFSALLVRSLPAIARIARSRSEDRQEARLPGDLAALELRGRLLGPWRYMASRRTVRSTDARQAPGIGTAPELLGDRSQAGAQTRT